VDLRNEPALYGPKVATSRELVARCCVATRFPDVWTPVCADSGIDDGWAECHRKHTRLALGGTRAGGLSVKKINTGIALAITNALPRETPDASA